MNVLHAGEVLSLDHPSIFLAGPTPRRPDVSSWRPAVLDLLRMLGFAGRVLVPERRDWSARFSYLDQVEWEHAGLEGCTVVAFWVPRDLERLPGFTTNVEFGRYAELSGTSFLLFRIAREVGKNSGIPSTGKVVAESLQPMDADTPERGEVLA